VNWLNSLRGGWDTAKQAFKGQRAIYKAALSAWKGKAVYCEVEDSKAYFQKKALKKLNAELILKGFKVKHVDGGALLFRKKINYSPEECAAYLNKEMPGAAFRVIEAERR